MANNSKHVFLALLACATTLVVTSCSTTKGVPEGDQLYTGLKKIKYENYEDNSHFTSTQEELEAALACEPNGAFLGSSYYRTPFPISLWIWNAFSGSTSGAGKWISKTFGKPPVLMSWVNPALRASVGQNTLKNHGYFQGRVKYEVFTQKNPKKAKIGYSVNVGPLYTLDSVAYLNFPPEITELIASRASISKLQKGSAFSVSSLDTERNRISNLLRDNGYYYYQPGYSSFLADTIQVPQKVQLKMLPTATMPETAKRRWYVGKIDFYLRKQMGETLTDSVKRKRLTVYYNGKRSPIRSRILLRNIQVHPGRMYRYRDENLTSTKLMDMGLFSMTDFKFTPRDTTSQADTLDLSITGLLEKPYDFYVETNYTGKTNGRMGPALIVGFTKRNAFRGAEKLDLNVFGSYEWQTGYSATGSAAQTQSYEYGASASLEFPRLFTPFWQSRRFYNTPSSLIKVSSSVISRGNYFKRHIVSGELTYNVQTSERSMHQFSPISLQYNYMTSHTATFDSILNANPYLKVTMKDVFIPKMRYSYIYNSPSRYRHPIWWQTTLSEASNILSLAYMAAGKKWNEKDKTMFKNPFAHFFKLETEWRKIWKLNPHSQLVAHVSAGAIWSYGNATEAPYSEQFYVGGANSIRAFTARSIGPGGYYPTASTNSYLDQTGDIKLLFNLEYRPRLIGSLYGAIYLDAGNVWAMHSSTERPNSTFKAKSLVQDMALGTGIGLRYDLDFFVIRVDWGIGIHVPYKSGFYNMGSFKNSQSLHLAIGYPF